MIKHLYHARFTWEYWTKLETLLEYSFYLEKCDNCSKVIPFTVVTEDHSVVEKVHLDDLNVYLDTSDT